MERWDNVEITKFEETEEEIIEYRLSNNTGKPCTDWYPTQSTSNNVIKEIENLGGSLVEITKEEVGFAVALFGLKTTYDSHCDTNDENIRKLWKIWG